METTVNVTTYAKKLRARQTELEAQRKKEVAAHKAAVAKWRTDLAAWVTANAGRVQRIALSKPNRWGGDDRLGFEPRQFFIGAPKAPVAPSDENLRRVRALLRQLSITGQKTVRISTREVAELFGEGKLDE